MKRRTFIEAVAGVGAASLLMGASDPGARIGVSTWSLHPYFKATHRAVPGTPPQEGDLKLLDFFALVKERWGVVNYEVVNTHFDSREPVHLADIRAALGASGGRIYNMPCDIPKTSLSDDDDTKRAAAVAAVKQWIDVAVSVGSPSIRCNTGNGTLGQAIKSYSELAEYGQSRNVRVTIENHGGLSGDPANIVELIKSVGNPVMGACPDFGNGFKTEAARHAGLAALFPYAKVCHAKTLEFNDKGEMTSFDFPACIKLAEKSGFKGMYSIEYEGSGDPMQGVTWTIALLKKALALVG
jgi:sugar phosphate isomerase/epimerase